MDEPTTRELLFRILAALLSLASLLNIIWVIFAMFKPKKAGKLLRLKSLSRKKALLISFIAMIFLLWAYKRVHFPY